MSYRKILMATACALLAAFVFVPTTSFAADKEALKKDIRTILKENPDILLEVLKENEMALFDILQSAAVKKRNEAAQSARTNKENEFRNPKKPVIEKGRPVKGNPKAPITIVEYSDFQCPYCARGSKTVDSLLKKYKGKVRLVFKHNPITNIHPHALPAAIYFEAIARQSEEKAWKFHHMIFEDQTRLNGGERGLKKMVAKLDLDKVRLAKDVKDPAIMKQISRDSTEARKFGFTGTPGYLINGVSLRGAYPEPAFAQIIDRFLKK